MKKDIFVALSTFARQGDEPKKILNKSGYSYEVNSLNRRLVEDEVIELGKGYKAIVAGLEPYSRQVLTQLDGLKCISRCGVGVDNIDLETAKEKNVIVCNTPDVVVQPVAELTLAMMFDLVKHLTRHTKLLQAGQWEKIPGNLLANMDIGILGLGRIGKRVAECLSLLGVNVYAYDIEPDHTWLKEHNVKLVSLEELLKVSDILSIHIATRKDNPFQLGANEFKRMKEGAFLVNVSRGDLVDEAELFKNLNNGRLSGAALDVYQQEPYDGPLCKLDNVVLTPHLATLTQESRIQMEAEAVRNALKVLKQL